MMETNDNRDRNTVEGGRSGPSPALIGFGILAILAVVFIVQNRKEVKTEFLFLSFDAKVWTTILIAMVIGAVLDRLLQIWWRRRRND